MSKLRSFASGPPDAAMDVASDRLASEDPLGVVRDVSDATSDSPPDESELGDAMDASDAIHPADAPQTDDVAEGDTLESPQASVDQPQVSSDVPQTSLDVGSMDGDDTTVDLARRDASTPIDVVLPGETGNDAGRRGNGSVCTSADQCQSGFCVGTPGRCCVQGCTSVCYRSDLCATGSCVPAQGTVTCSDLDALCGLVVKDYANASDWSIQTDLQVGDLAVSTDDHRITDVPSDLVGAPWIQPSRLSKSATANPLVTFNLSAPADVYVGVDARVSTPSWLSSWTDSGLTLSYRAYSSSAPPTMVTQRLLQMRFPAGSVSLGPLACMDTSNCSMYLTVIRFADQPAGCTR